MTREHWESRRFYVSPGIALLSPVNSRDAFRAFAAWVALSAPIESPSQPERGILREDKKEFIGRAENFKNFKVTIRFFMKKDLHKIT